MVGPFDGAAAGFLDDPCAEVRHHADFFGQGNELVRHDHAVFRVAPAQQCFDTERFVCRQIDDRLKVKLEFVARQCLGEVELQRAAGAQLVVHLGAEQPIAVASLRI